MFKVKNKDGDFVNCPVGLVYCVVDADETDIPRKLSEAAFDECKGYEPLFYRGTYSEYVEYIEKEIRSMQKYVNDKRGILDKIVLDFGNITESKKRIDKIEKCEKFRNWTEPSQIYIDMLKNNP